MMHARSLVRRWLAARAAQRKATEQYQNQMACNVPLPNQSLGIGQNALPRQGRK